MINILTIFRLTQRCLWEDSVIGAGERSVWLTRTTSGSYIASMRTGSWRKSSQYRPLCWWLTPTRTLATWRSSSGWSVTSGASGRGIKETFPKTNDTNRRVTYSGCTYNPMKTRYNGHMNGTSTKNGEHTCTTLSKCVRSLSRHNTPYNIKWEIVKRAALFNPITRICWLCIS